MLYLGLEVWYECRQKSEKVTIYPSQSYFCFDITVPTSPTLCRTVSISNLLTAKHSMRCTKGVETCKTREDDVIVVAYPKSGTHWVWEMVRLLQAGTTDVPLVEKDDGMIEDVVPETLEALPSPRALNTHAHFELMPQDILKKKSCKLIYVTRDPRDVMVSYFNHHRKLTQYYNYSGQWKDYFPLFLSGKVDYESWFAYTQGWEQGMKDNPDLQVHVTSYEALHENTEEEIKKTAGFLGTSADKAFLREVMKKTDFESMRATKGKNETFEGGAVMYRKGKVGDWKNWFTVAQSEQFDAVFEQEMKGTKAYELYSIKKQDFSTPDRNMNEK
ncbi:sulfotransferase family cytosolic 1b member 1 [Plakobranchus ocellatus]|uniref:Sulfotransferase family cytosolic 1b member 1 n=1 Tax=Plakobranchus ocellatus TaxID=259542 RepID=A0AAV4C2N9_9GAST|nr:sulfotransferase family cytosolic 1b member 1 [Plakobranchus ocellatus]